MIYARICCEQCLSIHKCCAVIELRHFGRYPQWHFYVIQDLITTEYEKKLLKI